MYICVTELCVLWKNLQLKPYNSNIYKTDKNSVLLSVSRLFTVEIFWHFFYFLICTTQPKQTEINKRNLNDPAIYAALPFKTVIYITVPWQSKHFVIV